MDQAYRRWATQFYVNHPSCGIILLALPYIHIGARKVMLAFTRIRQPISVRTRFRSTFARELNEYHAFKMDDTKPEYNLLSLREMLEGIETFISDPITMGFLSTAIRSAPYHDYSSVQETKEKTIEKELEAAMTTGKEPKLDYEILFSPDPAARRGRFHPNLPWDPILHAQLHHAFNQTKRVLEGHIFFPQVSDKTIGQDAVESSSSGLELGLDQLYSMDTIQSIADVERFYHLWGVELHGVVEMRSSWKYNVLKPRVYYAQGPDCYHASKYIQEVFNIILDHFDVVHRYNRYELPEDKLNGPSDRLCIYDYSSFTSSLDEVKAFTRALAHFYRDTRVVIVDTFRGPVTAILGEIILRYNDVCNEAAYFDISKLFELEARMILQHTTGMLGIPGNISSCTLLHGIHLVIAIGGRFRGRCVGDDALAIIRDGSSEEVWEMFITAVNNLGDIAEEKFEFWDDEDDPDTEGGAYCKRPITRCHSAILQEPVIIWPAIQNLVPLKDPYHFSAPITQGQITKTFIAQWSRLLTRIETLSLNIPDMTRQLLDTFQRWGYRVCGLGGGGIVHIEDLGYQLISPKVLSPDEFGTDWKYITMSYIKQTSISHSFPRWAGLDDPIGYTAGEVFHHQSTRLLALLEKLGYVQKELEREEIVLAEITCQEYLDQLLLLSYKFSYVYTVVVDCPNWANVVSNLELMPPHERISNLWYTQGDNEVGEHIW